MVEYICQRCKKEFNHLGNYNFHINRKYKCKESKESKECNNVINNEKNNAINNETNNIINNEKDNETNNIINNVIEPIQDEPVFLTKRPPRPRIQSSIPPPTSPPISSTPPISSIPLSSIIPPTSKNLPEKEEFICDYCEKKYLRKDTLTRHEKTCQIKKEEIKRLDEGVKRGDMRILKQLAEAKEKEEIEKKEKEEKEKLEIKSKNTQLAEIKPRGTVARYIVDNYKDAPPLQYMGYKLTEQDIRIMMHCGAVKGLCAIIEKIYICGILANNRSLWCTDMSRSKYYIKMACEDGSKWILEQYGLAVITPCIKDISSQVTSYYVAKYGTTTRKTNEELFDMNKLNILMQGLNADDTDRKVMQELAGKCTLDAYVEIDKNMIDDMKKSNNLMERREIDDDNDI